jgi:iron complex outermembrane recepter protein
MKTLSKHLLTSAILALLASPTWAQSGTETPAAKQAEADEGDTQALDTIVVTARKRSEELQDAAAAITAFSSDDIETLGIDSIDDVALLTTGLNYSPIFGNIVATPIIRGSAQTFGAPNVGVFLDGVYLTGKSAIDLALADLDRIEVVKGPQSALYGRNTFAGAINYITKAPTFEPSARVRLTAGGYGLAEALASYSGPITDTLAFRVAGRHREHDGYFTSSLDGGEIDFEKSSAIGADLSYLSDFGLDAILRINYSDDDNGQPASQVVRANGLNRVTPIIPPTTGLGLAQTYVGQLPDRPDRLSVNTRRGVGTAADPTELNEYGYRENTWRASLAANYTFDFATLTSITAWSRRETEYQLEGDNTVCDRPACPNFGPPIAGNTSRIATSSEDGVIRDLSQELRLTSDDTGPFTWLGGVFYYHSNSKAVQRSLAPITGAASFGFPFLGNRSESIAVFASVGYRFNERWGLNVEGRSEHEEQEFLQAPTRPAGVPAGNASLAVFDLKQDFDFFTPKAVLDFKASDNALFYASVGKGVKSGGFNSNLRILADQRTYGEESSWTYELGAKLNWLDGRLRTNAALYRTDWEDQQVACQNPVSAGGTSTQRTYVCNVGESEITGIELDTQMQLGQYWTAAVGYTYTDAKYSKFVDDSLAATLVNAGLPPYNFNGRSLPYVPENAVFASLNGEFEISENWNAFAHFDINRQSKQYLRADNLAFIRGRTLANLRLGVRSQAWTITGAVENLFDDDAAVTGVRFFDAVNFSVPAPLVTWSNPRQFSLSVQYDF